jgi:hypothetical protein
MKKKLKNNGQYNEQEINARLRTSAHLFLLLNQIRLFLGCVMKSKCKELTK